MTNRWSYVVLLAGCIQWGGVGCDGDDTVHVDASTADAEATGDDSGETNEASGPTCARPLNQWQQTVFDAHNEWRLSAEPKAANMYRLGWDWALADRAAQWISGCDPEWPHSTREYRTGVGGYEIVGENLAYCAETACPEAPSITDGSGTGAHGQGWWNQRDNYDWVTGSSSGQTLHYVQVVASKVFAIGCATAQCDAPGPRGWDGTWWWTSCLYGRQESATWSGTQPYEAGTGGLIDPPDTVYNQHPELCVPR